MSAPPFERSAQKETPHQQGQGDKEKTHPKDSTQLVPLVEETDIGYLATPKPVLRTTSGRYTYALYARPVDLLNEACTCLATGKCAVCKAWAATMRVNEERRALHERT